MFKHCRQQSAAGISALLSNVKIRRAEEAYEAIDRRHRHSGRLQQSFHFSRDLKKYVRALARGVEKSE